MPKVKENIIRDFFIKEKNELAIEAFCRDLRLNSRKRGGDATPNY